MNMSSLGVVLCPRCNIYTEHTNTYYIDYSGKVCKTSASVVVNRRRFSILESGIRTIITLLFGVMCNLLV